MAKFLKIDADGTAVLGVVELPDDLPASEQAVTASVDVPIGIGPDAAPITEKREVPVLDGEGKQVVVAVSPYNTREMSAKNGKPFLLPITNDTVASIDPTKQKLGDAQYVIRDGDADVVMPAVDLSADEVKARVSGDAQKYLVESYSQVIELAEQALLDLANAGSIQEQTATQIKSLVQQRQTARAKL